MGLVSLIFMAVLLLPLSNSFLQLVVQRSAIDIIGPGSRDDGQH